MDKDGARSGPHGRERRFLTGDALSLEVREAEGEQPKTLSWYAALFDTLSEPLGGFRERIGRRAFSKSLERDDIRGLINHDPNMILGRTSKKTLKLSVDNAGLHANVVLPDTNYARDLVVNIQNGNITGGSFMFEALKDDWGIEDVDGEETLVRTVKEVKLYDVSPVTFPAYTATEGSASVRSLAELWKRKLILPTQRRAVVAEGCPHVCCVMCDMANCSVRMECCAGCMECCREMCEDCGQACKLFCCAMCQSHCQTMCAGCPKTTCSMQGGTGMRSALPAISRYRRRLELLKLRNFGGKVCLL